MKYIYTLDNCPKCVKLKEMYDSQGIEYTERDGGRLKTPAADQDNIDKDAFVQLSMQNMVFPIEVDV